MAWFWLSRPSEPQPLPSERHPDLLIEAIEMAVTDRSGRLVRRIRAASLRRMTAGGPSELERPRLELFQELGASWRFEAQSGEVSPDMKTIHLAGEVRGRRATGPRFELDTSEVVILAPRNYGETDRPAVIRGERYEARGTGLRVWMDEGRAELLADANGTYRER